VDKCDQFFRLTEFVSPDRLENDHKSVLRKVVSFLRVAIADSCSNDQEDPAPVLLYKLLFGAPVALQDAFDQRTACGNVVHVFYALSYAALLLFLRLITVQKLATPRLSWYVNKNSDTNFALEDKRAGLLAVRSAPEDGAAQSSDQFWVTLPAP
jgi:hypothetical protein